MADTTNSEGVGGSAPTSTSPTPTPTPAQLREDMIASAVSFLSHAKVRSSPTSSKRSFLEQKGLTAAEIDEAFRRVPDTEHDDTHLPQLGVTSTQYATGAQPSQQQLQSIQQQPGAHWGQVALGVGFAGASVYAIKSLFWPYVSDAIKSWRGDNNTDSTITRDTAPTITELPSDSEDNQGGDDKQNSSHILASAIKSQTKELRGAIESMKSFVERLEKGKAVDEGNSSDSTTPSGSAGLTIAELRQELRSFASTLNEMAKPDTSTTSNNRGGKNEGRLEAELSDIKALLNEFLKSPPNASGTLTPHHHQYQHHRDGDQHTTPASSRPPPQSISSSTLVNRDGDTGSSPSYMEVLEMLEKGQTPPGIRTDINDKPPNPNQPPPEPKLKPKPKPWEGRASSVSVGGDNGNGNGNEKSGYGGEASPSPTPTSFFTGMVPPNNNNNNTTPSLNNNGSSSSSTKPASNIYEAATSPSQPGGVIVGRLSPDNNNNNYSRALSGWEKRNNMNLGMMMMGNMGDNMEVSLGRPTSKEWKPPPMPTPSLYSGGSVGERGRDGGTSSLSLGDAFSAE